MRTNLLLWDAFTAVTVQLPGSRFGQTSSAGLELSEGWGLNPPPPPTISPQAFFVGKIDLKSKHMGQN